MAKYCSTLVLDAALDYIIDNGAKICVCTSSLTPTSTTIADHDSTTGNALAVTTLTTGSGSTSYTKAAGDVSGRKVTVTQQASIAIAATGVAAYISIVNTASSVVIYVTECTTQALTSTSNKVTIPAFDIEFRDAT